MARKRNCANVLVNEEDENRVEELKKRINDLPQGDPTKCEGLIRELHKKVLAVLNPQAKDQLLTELKTVSSCGLNGDLQEKIKKSGLSLEGLDLVTKYLTTTIELAQYLFVSSDDDVKNDGLEVFKRRLGPSLEVMGGLTSMGIDVNKEWAKRLVKEVPSLQTLARVSISDLTRLCEEGDDKANSGEMNVVRNLIKIAESRSRNLSVNQEEPEEGEKEEPSKAIDEEKLEKARALMNEAKEEAANQSEEAKKAVQEKMNEITKILQLPSDWYKQENVKKPEQLLEQLGKIIEQFDNVVEVSDSYKNDIEVVEKASGGRALCGISYSKYAAPRTAERPLIILPEKVTLSSPNNSQQVRYLKFSKSRAAANYVQTVKSSSTDIGFSVGGFVELFVGDVHGRYGSSQEEESVKSASEDSNHVSVLQYIWIATKTFKIEQEQIRLSMSARKMAMSIMKYKDLNQSQQAARNFMTRYGSHFPAGLHTLGGVLFRTVDAESSKAQNTSELTAKAASQLQGQISVGFLGSVFGVGASFSAERTSSSGDKRASHQEEDDTSYTYAVQSMGPATTNPVTFSKLLANNSTWALIDRGSQHAYIPVWELIRELGGDYEEAAQVLETTWAKDENDRKEGLAVEQGNWEPENRDPDSDNRRKILGNKVLEVIENDLLERAVTCISKVSFSLFLREMTCSNVSC